MKFSIITPSFRQLNWLKLCATSIADQKGVELEHIVQDAGTGAELEAWAAEQSGLQLFVEKDEGMYDAVNRGLKRANGEILAYLNCDEQYLPGTLKTVHDFFEAHPEVDVLFGDVVVTDNDGGYVCSRPVVMPQSYHTQTCGLATFTAATFFRRRILDEHQLYFDTKWKMVGDALWILEMLRHKLRLATLRRYTSSFADTGENLALTPDAEIEGKSRYELVPKWIVKMRPVWVAHYRLRRLLAGIYFPKPFSYEIYTPASPANRHRFSVDKPTAYWKSRM